MPYSSLYRALLAALLLSPAWAPMAVAEPQAAVLTPAARLAVFEARVEARRVAHHVPGAVLAVVRGDRLTLLEGLGHRDAEAKTPVTADTRFAIGSTTKAFTALTAVLAAEDGKLSLSDRPQKFLPYFHLQDPEANAKVTLTDLMSHRTGLGRTDLSLLASGLTREEMIRIACQAKPESRFREAWHYNNQMFVAAGEAVAKAYGQPWEEVLAERVLEPLGLTETTTSLTAAKASEHAQGYVYNENTHSLERLPMRDISAAAPAGAIYSTGRDMARWARFLLAGGVLDGKRLLSAKALSAVFTPQMPIAPGVQYGLGWILESWHGHPVYWHDGSVDGYNAMIALMPDQSLGVVILTNVTASPLTTEARRLAWECLVDSQVAPEPAVSYLGAAANQSLLGPYRHARTQFEVTLAARDGHVALLVAGQPAYGLIPDGHDQFKLAGLPDSYRLTLTRNAQGLASGFTLRQPQGELKFEPRRPFQAPLSAPALMAKVIEAQGGEAALRKHSHLIQWLTLDYENQGVKSRAVVRQKAPYQQVMDETLWALDKRIGWVRDRFDGTTGETRSSLGPPEVKLGSALANARNDLDFYAALDWRSIYETVTITGRDKVAGEEVFVVEKTPKTGTAVKDYVSTKTFRVLRRDFTLTGNTAEASLPMTDWYSDFRQVDGVTMPFHIVRQHPGMGRIVIQSTRASFEEPVPDEVFLK